MLYVLRIKKLKYQFYFLNQICHKTSFWPQDNGIEYNNETEDKEGKRCSIQLQRETPEGLTDSPCGLWVEKAGLCR